MPCLPCRSNMMGLVQMAQRSGRGPTSDVPVLVINNLGSGGFVPEGFLSPRLCMLCGSIFCPPIVDVPTGPEDPVAEPLEVARTGRVRRETLAMMKAGGAPFESLPLGPEDFPGSDEGSHFMAQERFEPVAPIPEGLRRRKPLPISPEWRPNTAMAVLRLLEDRCRMTSGALEDAQMDEARQVLAAAVQTWKTIHGEG